MKLEGKVAIVTGAASGIGQAMALRFAKEGARVMATDVNESGVNGTLETIRAEGGSGLAFIGDIGDRDCVKTLVAQAEAEFGAVDILCNNAGVLDALTPLAECEDDMWERVMRVNLTGPMMACREVLPGMIERGGGAILNTASIAADGGGRGGAAYTVSKHGVLGLTRSTAWYYGDKGIRCNAIAPGAIMTPMAMQTTHEGGAVKLATYLPAISRYGEPAEVAGAALFLVSDEAKYINGSVLTIDGGWTLF